jgi:3-deoxy-D-manno-octulosonate 8-phosphate phosphatase (KDO 8-P phosphatase)
MTSWNGPVSEGANLHRRSPGSGGALPISGPVRILFLDVDGTLTDGVIGWDGNGDSRNFWVRDGIALEWAKGLGLLPVVISGRDSPAVVGRMDDLGLESYLGIKDKVAVAEQVLRREGVTWADCAMVGDDLPDVPLMKRVAWPIAVANAQPEVKTIAKSITALAGGLGAVREVVEMLLKHNGSWGKVLEKYEA